MFSRKVRQQFFRCILSVQLALIGSPLLAETSTTADDGHAQHHLGDWPGVYLGFTPCADCIGIKTTLALNKSGSYLLITQYAGKSEREFTEKGKFTWGEKPNTIILTSRKGDNQQQYLVGDNVLIQLDQAGNRISGKQADRYILRRTDMTEKDTSHAH